VLNEGDGTGGIQDQDTHDEIKYRRCLEKRLVD
jgi:hypothetical protein